MLVHKILELGFLTTNPESLGNRLQSLFRPRRASVQQQQQQQQQSAGQQQQEQQRRPTSQQQQSTSQLSNSKSGSQRTSIPRQPQQPATQAEFHYRLGTPIEMHGFQFTENHRNSADSSTHSSKIKAGAFQDGSASPVTPPTPPFSSPRKDQGSSSKNLERRGFETKDACISLLRRGLAISRTGRANSVERCLRPFGSAKSQQPEVSKQSSNVHLSLNSQQAAAVQERKPHPSRSQSSKSLPLSDTETTTGAQKPEPWYQLPNSKHKQKGKDKPSQNPPPPVRGGLRETYSFPLAGTQAPMQMRKPHSSQRGMEQLIRKWSSSQRKKTPEKKRRLLHSISEESLRALST